MGRAIVREPQAFLMDEPLSNLDAKLRVQMRAEIARIQRAFGVTTIYVTHDQSEAMTLGDRVVVMRGGVIQQVDTPQRVYDRPANLFVAEFIGSPAMNLVEATLEQDDDGLWVRFGSSRLRVVEDVTDIRPALPQYVGRRVALGVRPEDVEDAAVVPTAIPARRFAAEVDIREDMGAEVYLHLKVDAERVSSDAVREALEPEAAEVAEQTERRGTGFVARVDRETAAREGERIELAVDLRRLHFFDLETGLGIYERERAEVAAPAAAAR
jgi:multiple sugar transport system ATP-binding protein